MVCNEFTYMVRNMLSLCLTDPSDVWTYTSIDDTVQMYTRKYTFVCFHAEESERILSYMNNIDRYETDCTILSFIHYSVSRMCHRFQYFGDIDVCVFGLGVGVV